MEHEEIIDNKQKRPCIQLGIYLTISILLPDVIFACS